MKRRIGRAGERRQQAPAGSRVARPGRDRRVALSRDRRLAGRDRRGRLRGRRHALRPVRPLAAGAGLSRVDPPRPGAPSVLRDRVQRPRDRVDDPRGRGHARALELRPADRGRLGGALRRRLRGRAAARLDRRRTRVLGHARHGALSRRARVPRDRGRAPVPEPDALAGDDRGAARPAARDRGGPPRGRGRGCPAAPRPRVRARAPPVGRPARDAVGPARRRRVVPRGGARGDDGMVRVAFRAGGRVHGPVRVPLRARGVPHAGPRDGHARDARGLLPRAGLPLAAARGRRPRPCRRRNRLARPEAPPRRGGPPRDPRADVPVALDPPQPGHVALLGPVRPRPRPRRRGRARGDPPEGAARVPGRAARRGRCTRARRGPRSTRARTRTRRRSPRSGRSSAGCTRAARRSSRTGTSTRSCAPRGGRAGSSSGDTRTRRSPRRPARRTSASSG